MDVPSFQKVKNSIVSDYCSLEGDADEYSEIEAEILAFCEQ